MRALTIRLAVLAGTLAVILLAGTVGFSIVEDLPPGEAFYFTVVTVATVGYGDITPLTQAGKVLSIILILFGVGTFTGVIVNATGYLSERRQCQVRAERTSMLMGLYMSEIGTPLLELLHCADPALSEINHDALLGQEWGEADFHSLRDKLSRHKFALDPSLVRLQPLRDLLEKKTDLLFRLLENPVLLEREEFTETLRMTSHMREELMARPSVADLPPADVAHLAGDAARAYGQIARGWVEYMFYLKRYPYLFSLALRNNPFNENRCAIIR